MSTSPRIPAPANFLCLTPLPSKSTSAITSPNSTTCTSPELAASRPQPAAVEALTATTLVLAAAAVSMPIHQFLVLSPEVRPSPASAFEPLPSHYGSSESSLASPTSSSRGGSVSASGNANAVTAFGEGNKFLKLGFGPGPDFVENRGR